MDNNQNTRGFWVLNRLSKMPNKLWWLVFIIFAVGIVVLKLVILPEYYKNKLAHQRYVMAATTDILLKASKIDFPKIVAYKNVTTAQITSPLTLLIPSDAQKLRAYGAVFSDHKTGFKLTFAVPRNLITVDREIIPAQLHKSLWHGTGEGVGVWVLTQSSFKAQIIETSLADNNTSVSIIWVNE